jgi:proteasome lid subunit RPN8/RPN11
MRTYPGTRVPPDSVGQEPPPTPEPALPDGGLRIVRENGVAIANCPNCGETLRFGRVTGRQIQGPRDIAEMLVDEMSALEREELRVAVLNTRNGVLAVPTVYMGNVSASLVRVGELFCEAVRRQASAILLIHNHPSGDPTPSPDDLRLTAEALAAGRILDIQLLDHVVIGGGTWVSLRDRGVAFSSAGDRENLRLSTPYEPQAAGGNGVLSASTGGAL